MLCVSLDERGVWGRMDTCVSVTESLHGSSETITTLLTGYTPIQNKVYIYIYIYKRKSKNNNKK